MANVYAVQNEASLNEKEWPVYTTFHCGSNLISAMAHPRPRYRNLKRSPAPIAVTRDEKDKCKEQTGKNDNNDKAREVIWREKSGGYLTTSAQTIGGCI